MEWNSFLKKCCILCSCIASHHFAQNEIEWNVHLKIAKSGSELMQQTRQLNLLRKNRTLASLQLDKQNTTMLIKQTTR